MHALALSGSTLYAGGEFTQLGGQPRNYLGAVSTATGSATTWAPNANSWVQTLVVSGSKVLAGGWFNYLNYQTRDHLLALSATTGGLLPFSPNPNGTVEALALSGSTLYAGGSFTQIGGRPRNRLAAVNTATGLASTWNPGANGTVEALAMSGSTLYVGGSFTQLGGQTRNRIGALSTSANTVTSWNPNAYSNVHALAVSGSEVLAGGSFTYLNYQPRGRLLAVNTTTGQILPWDPQANSTVQALVLSGSTLYAGGSFSQIGGQPRNRLAAVSTVTGLASTWDPGASSTVEALALSGSTLYAGGQFTQLGGQTRNRIGALSTASNTATPWDPNANSTVHTLALSGSTVYAGGSFTQIGGQTRNRIAALSTTNGLATAWNPNLNGGVYTLVKDQDYVFAGGSFTQAGGQAVSNFVLLNANTGLPVEMYPQFNSSLNVLHYDRDNSTLYAGGNFTRVGDKDRNYFASFQVPSLGSVSDQTITFNAITDKTLIEDPLTLGAAASSGLPVSFSVVSGPATVSGNQLTFTGPGLVTVRATQAGDAGFNPAPPVERSFNVTKASQTISFAALATRTLDESPFTLSASATSGLPVSFSVVSGPATVSGNTVTLTGIGTVTIRAAQAGDADYQAAPHVYRSFSVTTPEKANQTISFAALPGRTFGDGPVTLSASASSGLPVSFRLFSGPAALEGNVLRLTGAGEVVVEAQQDGDGTYNAAPPVQHSFFVAQAAQTIAFAQLSDKTCTEAPFELLASATSGLPVSFSVVSGPAAIAGNVLTLTGAGTVTVRAHQAGNGHYQAATPVDRSFAVAGARQFIMIRPGLPNRYGEQTYLLEADAFSGLPVTIQVISGPATIDGNTVSTKGRACVRFIQPGNACYAAAPPVETCFGQFQPQTISFAALPGRTFGDAPFPLSATASSGLPVSFLVVSGPATLSGNMLTLTGVGPVTVRATQAGDASFDPAPPVERTFTVQPVGICSGTGGLLREYWLDLSRGGIATIPPGQRPQRLGADQRL